MFAMSLQGKRIVVLMIDGFGQDYFERSPMPHLGQMARDGLYKPGRCVFLLLHQRKQHLDRLRVLAGRARGDHQQLFDQVHRAGGIPRGRIFPVRPNDFRPGEGRKRPLRAADLQVQDGPDPRNRPRAGDRGRDAHRRRRAPIRPPSRDVHHRGQFLAVRGRTPHPGGTPRHRAGLRAHHRLPDAHVAARRLRVPRPPLPTGRVHRPFARGCAGRGLHRHGPTTA